ncbi:Hypothetical predicted protein, partial [Paramuricea clavata]
MFDPVESVGDEGLIRAVQRFWDTESLGIFEPNPSLEKEFLRDSNFNKNQGRYQCSKVDETVLTEVKPLESKQDVFTNSTEKENRTERDSNEANDDILSARSEADDDPKPECSIKILGLNWNINTDEIHYDLTALYQRATLRVTALLKRFGDKTRRQPVSIEVTANELRAAEKLWVNTIQASNFEDERSYLQGVSKKEPLLVRQLDLFLDEEGTIRCQGRIDKSSLPMTTKRPILLPARHFYTQLVIRNCHEVVHHNGVKETLNCIREVYWIPRGREAVKRVIGVCVTCRKHEGKPYGTPKFAQLPSCR